MPRIKHIDRPIDIRGNLPESIWLKLQVELYSEVEGRIPYGAMSKWLQDRAVEWLKARGVSV